MAKLDQPAGADDAALAPLQQRIAELEQQLLTVTAQRDVAQEQWQRDQDTLLRGPFVIFRWVAAEGWPVEFVSENVVQLLGHTAADFVSGRVPFASVVFPEDLERVGSEVNEHTVAGDASFEQEYRIVHKNGDVRWIYDFTAIIRNDAGQTTHYYGYVLDITPRKLMESERERLQQQVIESQQATLHELSTPLIPVSSNAVVMPLIGTIDSRRAQQVLEALLQGVAEHGAAIAILDITGVQVVDTQVAQVLVQAAQAAQLLGTQVVLTGLRPEVAQTLVHLGADLHKIVTLNSLRMGISYALSLDA